MIRAMALLLLLASGAAPQGVTGRVMEDHSGSALASVEVRVRRTGAQRLLADLETGPDGTFRLPALPPGDYRFEFRKPNYLDTTLQFQGTVPPAPAVRLVRCGVIAGRVLDQQGRPVRGAVVYAMPRPPGGGPLRPMAQAPGNYALVDQNGQYRLFYLQPGEYAVAAAYGASSIVLGMTGSANVNPAVGSGVAFYPEAARPQFLSITGGEDYRDIDLSLPPAASFSVSGKVDAPAAAPEAGRYWLTLASVDQPALAAAATEADAKGAFRFQGVAAGAYYLFASGPSNARFSLGAILPSSPNFARSRVDVVAQNVAGLVVAPQKGAAVTLVMQAAPEARKACPESAQLTLTGLEDWGALLERKATVSSREQTLRDLAPARYQARLEGLGSLCYQASDPMVDIAGGGSQTVVLRVSAGGAIRGRLVGAEHPQEFAAALLAADATGGERAVMAAVPDAQGRFVFEGLRPGKYYVAAQRAAASKVRWIADPSRMLELDIRGGSPTELELPVTGEGGK